VCLLQRGALASPSPHPACPKLPTYVCLRNEAWEMCVHTVDWETSMSGTDNRPRAPKRDGEQGRARRRSDSLQARTRPAAAAQPAKASREQPEQKDSSPGGSSAPSEQCYLCRTLLRVLRDKQPRCPL